MENKKEKKTNWWSITAFIFSIGAFGLSFIRVNATYDLSDTSYISIIVTLMGVCATFIVCYQIYNTIEINQQLIKLGRLAEDISKWEVLKYETEGNLEISKGFIHQSNGYYYDAFRCYQTAFYFFLHSGTDKKIVDVLTNLDNCAQNIDTIGEIKEIENLSDKIEVLTNFPKYKTVYNNILKKINNEK